MKKICVEEVFRENVLKREYLISNSTELKYSNAKLQTKAKTEIDSDVKMSLIGLKASVPINLLCNMSFVTACLADKLVVISRATQLCLLQIVLTRLSAAKAI